MFGKLSALFGRPRRPAPARRVAPQRKPVPLGVETLEGREVPATIFNTSPFGSASGGSFGAPFSTGIGVSQAAPFTGFGQSTGFTPTAAATGGGLVNNGVNGTATTTGTAGVGTTTLGNNGLGTNNLTTTNLGTNGVTNGGTTTTNAGATTNLGSVGLGTVGTVGLGTGIGTGFGTLGTVGGTAVSERQLLSAIFQTNVMNVLLGSLAATQGSTPQIQQLGLQLESFGLQVLTSLQRTFNSQRIGLNLSPSSIQSFATLSQQQGTVFDQNFLNAINLQAQQLAGIQPLI